MNLSLPVIIGSFLAAASGGAQSLPGDPSAADSLVRSAVAAYDGGAYERVIDLLQPSAGTPRTARAYFYLGSSFAALNDPQNAIRYLRMAVDSSGGEIPYRFQLAKSLSASGAPADARAQYQRILAQDSTFLPALFNLGTLCFDARQYGAAAELFSRVVRLNPRDYLSYYDLGASLVNMGKPDSALQFLRASMALNLRYVPCLNLTASLYYKRKEYQDAERLYAMIVARDSLNADTWARRGYCMEKLGDSKRALECFRNAAKLDTTNSGYYARVGQSFFELKLFDSAAVNYLRAASLDDENPVLSLNAGFSYARLDSLERALDAFHMSYVASHTERLGVLYSQIGGIYYKQKRFRQAAASYLKSLEFDPGNKRAYFFLAHSQEEIRNFQGAAASYARFLRLAAGDPDQSDLVPYARKRLAQLTTRK